MIFRTDKHKRNLIFFNYFHDFGFFFVDKLEVKNVSNNEIVDQYKELPISAKFDLPSLSSLSLFSF
jgi:hypothetical protein